MCHVVIGPQCSTVLLLSFPSSIFLLICLLLLFFFFLFSISNLLLTWVFLTSAHSWHIGHCLSHCSTSDNVAPITHMPSNAPSTMVHSNVTQRIPTKIPIVYSLYFLI